MKKTLKQLVAASIASMDRHSKLISQALSVASVLPVPTPPFHPHPGVISANWVPTFELDSIYGYIKSAGDTPPLGVPFEASTYYYVKVLEGFHLKCTDQDGHQWDWQLAGNTNSNLYVGREIGIVMNQIDILEGAQIDDMGLRFLVATREPMPVLIDPNDSPYMTKGVAAPARNFEVIYGTPTHPNANISWYDDTKPAGEQQQLGNGTGNTQMIRSYSFQYANNCKVIDLGLA